MELRNPASHPKTVLNGYIYEVTAGDLLSADISSTETTEPGYFLILIYVSVACIALFTLRRRRSAVPVNGPFSPSQNSAVSEASRPAARRIVCAGRRPASLPQNKPFVP